MKGYLLGIDLGTSAAKVGLFNLKGDLEAFAEEGYGIERPKPNYAEMDPRLWWEAVERALRLLSLSQVSLDFLLAIGTTGQTRGQVFLGKDGEILRPAIIWQDRRAIKEAKWMMGEFKEDDLERYLGYCPPLDPSFPPVRLLWLKDNEPEVFRAIYKVLQPKDYINYRLTGHLASDLASSFGLISFRTRRVEEEYFNRLKLSPEILPPLYNYREVIGTVSGEVSEETGIPKGVPVVAGTIDGFCSLFGSGIIGPGLGLEVAGTSEIVGFLAKKSVPIQSGIIAMPFSRELFFCGGPTQSGGESLKWFLDNFWWKKEISLSKKEEVEIYSSAISQVAEVPPGSQGLIFLPYLLGERAPLWDPRARGAFIGMTSSHMKVHLLRAVLEGVAYSIRHVLEEAERATDTTVSTLRLSGGGAKSRIWNQIKADVTNKVIERLKVSETAVLGAAILAGWGVGLFTDIKEILEEMVHIDESYFPSSQNSALYADLFQVYKALYPQLKDSFWALSLYG